MNKTSNLLAGVSLWLALAPAAGAAGFDPGKLAVLRVGDGGTGGASDFTSRQNPVFIDQYDCRALNQERSSFTVAIPARGTNALWINGNASTEGGMERSGDRSILTMPGYCGDILSQTGTPSRLDYVRGICVVDAAGSTRLAYRGAKWYGLAGEKTNPRDTVSDGANDFWGAGSAMGTLFYNGGDIAQFQQTPSTRAVKIINNALYVSITGSDGKEAGTDSLPGGIYSFTDGSGAAVALPKAVGAVMSPLVPVTEPYTHIVGFDLAPQGDAAYVADVAYGIQKYVKSAGGWKLAYNFYIPGYDGPQSGTLTNASSTTVRTGCFGLAVDFSGAHPVIYATTTDSIGYHGKSSNANRLIRIEDGNTGTDGETITNFGEVLATAGATNISFRALAFTPESRR